MTRPDDAVRGVNANAIEALQQELAATNVLLEALGRELASDRVETAVRVEGRRAELARQHRIQMMVVATGVVGITYAYDQQIEHCSPGARVVHGIDWLLSHPITPGETPESRQDGFTTHYDSAPYWCDVTMPLHTHDGSVWPTIGNGLGGVIVGVAALATAVYHRIKTARDFAKVAEAARMEEESNVRRSA